MRSRADVPDADSAKISLYRPEATETTSVELPGNVTGTSAPDSGFTRASDPAVPVCCRVTAKMSCEYRSRTASSRTMPFGMVICRSAEAEGSKSKRTGRSTFTFWPVASVVRPYTGSTM